MGWTFTHRDRGVSAKDFFAGEFDHEGGRVLDVAATFREAYIAYELLDKETGKSRGVVALVCLTRWVRDDYNFGWKDMDETMGPSATNCPARILDQLTPVDELVAMGSLVAGSSGETETRAWREACRKNLEARSKRPRLRKGDVLHWGEPLNYGPYGKKSVLRCVDARTRAFTDRDLLDKTGPAMLRFRVRREDVNRARWLTNAEVAAYVADQEKAEREFAEALDRAEASMRATA